MGREAAQTDFILREDSVGQKVKAAYWLHNARTDVTIIK